MKRIAVVDSSPLINLVHLELAEKLHFYFDTIYVPRMVHREVNRKSRFRYRLNKLYAEGTFRRCTTGDAVSVNLLLDVLDEGEAEVLVQASQVGAAVFIGDEKAGRTMSLSRGIGPIGTARLLARLHVEGFAADAMTLMKKLKRDLGCYVAIGLSTMPSRTQQSCFSNPPAPRCWFLETCGNGQYFP